MTNTIPEEVKKENAKEPMMQIKKTLPFKLKDKNGRGGIQFNLREMFGFLPEVVGIQKIEGQNNVLTFYAVIPPEVLAKEKNEQAKRVDKRQSKTD